MRVQNYVNLVTGFFPPPVWSQPNLDGNGIGVSGKAKVRFSSSYTIYKTTYFKATARNRTIYMIV